MVDRELYSSNPFATNHTLSKATLIVALGTPLRLLWYPKILPRFGKIVYVIEFPT